MTDGRDEEAQLRQVALLNARSIEHARMRAEDRLREQSEWLRITLASISDAVLTTDAEGRVTLLNSCAEALSGWRQQDALAMPVQRVIRIVNAKTLRPIENPALVALRTGTTVRLGHPVILVAKDGSERPIDDSASPIRSENGAILGAVLIFRDVTERHLADMMRRESESEREALLVSERAARAEAERAGSVKEAFLAMVSHELRTPLTAIVSWVQILRKTPPTQETLEKGLSTIERNARVQSKLIADLLDVSRIVSGKLRIEREPMEFPVVVAAAIESVQAAADAKGITIAATLNPIQAETTGDPQRLQQVIWNILSNAIKFTPRNGRVTVELTSAGDHIDIVISDNGEGIPQDFLPYVFERFRQAEHSKSREHGGLGLGLAIAKQLVEMHGGNVAATSAGRDKGSTFIVRLPVSAPDIADDAATAP